MKAHELAKQLLTCKDVEVTASIDISNGEDDWDARIFTDEFFGINSAEGDFDGDGDRVITLLFGATGQGIKLKPDGGV